MRLCASLCWRPLTPARHATAARVASQKVFHGPQLRVPPGFPRSTSFSHLTRVRDGPANKGAGDEPDELRKRMVDRMMVKSITLLIPVDNTETTKQPQYKATHLAKTSRADIVKVMDRRGCDFVKDPDSGELVTLSALDIHDNMTIIAEKFENSGIEKRVEGLEGFQTSAVTSHEQEACEALFNIFRKQYGDDVEMVPISKVQSKRGQTREVDGVVMAENVVGVMEAKTKVSGKPDIEQLESLMEFIRTQPLKGLGASVFSGKELRGFLAYEVTPSSQAAIDTLRKDCAEHHIGLIVTSGKGMSAQGNVTPGKGTA